MTLRSELGRHLEAYPFGTDADCAARKRFAALLDAPGDVFSRTHYEPGHVTASGFVLSPQGDRVLMILHAKLGLWLQPGGHVEPGDTSLCAAAMREVQEETGVSPASWDEAVLDLDVHEIPARPDAPAHEHFDVRFAFRARDLGLVQAAEVRAARWVPLGEVQQMQTDASVLRALSRLVARSSG